MPKEESTVQGLARPPDGGYGWVIVVGCILQWVFTLPVLNMYGFLFEPKFASCKTTPTEQVGAKFEDFFLLKSHHVSTEDLTT